MPRSRPARIPSKLVVGPRAVVFDFDGVIANSEPLHFRALSEVLAATGVHLSEGDYYAKYLGFDDVGTFAAVAADRTLAWTPGEVAELIRRKAEVLERLERGVSVLVPGAADAIRRLAARCPLAVASGALRPEIVRVLDHEGLTPNFRAIVASGDTAASKPTPDPYLRAVALLSERLGTDIPPGDCIAVEDSVWGLASARAAGLRTVAVTHTYSIDVLKTAADTVIEHLDGLSWELLSQLIHHES